MRRNLVYHLYRKTSNTQSFSPMTSYSNMPVVPNCLRLPVVPTHKERSFCATRLSLEVFCQASTLPKIKINNLTP